MKIAITGTMCVGKTTITKQLCDATKFAKLEEVARKLIEAGHEVDTKATPELELKMLKMQKKLESKKSNWIADRCLIDLLAYCTVLFPENSALLNTIRRELANAKYDIIFYLPIEFPIESDGDRSTDEKFQKQIDDAIYNLLKGSHFHTLSGTREARLEKALQIINKYNI